MSRRCFLTALTTIVALPRALAADASAARTLHLSHTHTGERLTIDYFGDGGYEAEALATVNHFLRDFRTNEVHEIDAGLLDLLHGLAGLTETRRPFEVISGFRSPATNAMLRQRGEGVAAGSLHMKGQAIDIRLTDVQLPKLRAAALGMKRGGVGFYPAPDFVHVDVGRVRAW